MNSPYYTVNEVAEYFKLCPSKVYDMVASGEIGAMKIGRAIRISQKHLEAYERRNDQPAARKERTYHF